MVPWPPGPKTIMNCCVIVNEAGPWAQLQNNKSNTPKSEPTNNVDSQSNNPIQNRRQETMPPQDCSPRACMSPSRSTSWSGQLVKGLHDSNPMCHQSSPEAVCSVQFQNISEYHSNASKYQSTNEFSLQASNLIHD